MIKTYYILRGGDKPPLNKKGEMNMRKILDTEFALNNVVTVGYLNKRGFWEVATGRIYDYSKDYICIDFSYDYVSLEDVIKIDIDKIKYFHKMPNQPMWR